MRLKFGNATSVVLTMCAVAMAATPGALADTIVTTPAGVFTNSGISNAGDTFAFDTWLRTNVRNDGSVGITTEYPRSGNGSLSFDAVNGPGGASSKADGEYYFSAALSSPDDYRLSDLTAFGYDWYRDSTSTAAAHLHPALRLVVDRDGNVATFDYSYLIFELAYNPSVSPVSTDTWVTNDVFAMDAILWRNGVENYTYRLSDFMSAGGALGINGNSVVVGVSTGVGSGWGPFSGAVDNVRIGFNSVTPTVFNFEVAPPIPEPATLGLLMLSLGGLAARRFRSHKS